MSENNPYTPPQSNVYQAEPSSGQINPDWEIGTVMSEAWAKVDGFKMTYFIAMVIYIVISTAVNGVVSFVGSESVFIGFIGQILIMLVTYPLAAGLMMMGIKRVRGLDVQPTMIFDYYPKTIPIFLLNLLMFALIAVGLILLVLPGIYLMIAYLLAVPLLIDKNFGIWQSLETSRKIITPCWFRFFGLVIVMSLIVIVSALPLLIGLIWTLPMFSLVVGIIYRDLIGFSE
jgi:hypothetical protein